MRKFKGSSDFLANASPTVISPVRQNDAGGRTAQDLGVASQVGMGFEVGFSSDSVLSALNELQSATPGVLAAHLHADPGNVSGFLNELEAQKFVEEAAPHKRGEEPHFSLTDVGKRLLRYRKMAKI